MLKRDKMVTVKQLMENLIKYEGEELIVDIKGMVDTQIDFNEFSIEEMRDEQGDNCIVLDNQYEVGYPLWIKEDKIECIKEIFKGGRLSDTP